MRFVFCGKPPKRSSNGLQAFFDLCQTLRELGNSVAFVPFLPNGKGGYVPISRSQIKGDLPEPFILHEDYIKSGTDIAVYSETFPGNFLGAEFVVRYYGNRIGNCSAVDPKVGGWEYKLAHSKQILSDPNFVLFYVNSIKLQEFRDVPPVKSRFLAITYDGKGTLYGPTPRIPGSIAITRDWPSTNEETMRLLSASNIVFSYDSFTQLNVEAALLGVLPVLVRTHPWTIEELRSTELRKLFFVTADEWAEEGRRDEFFSSIERQRPELYNEIEDLQKTWPGRVKEFVHHLKSHFSL